MNDIIVTVFLHTTTIDPPNKSQNVVSKVN